TYVLSSARRGCVASARVLPAATSSSRRKNCDDRSRSCAGASSCSVTDLTPLSTTSLAVSREGRGEERERECVRYGETNNVKSGEVRAETRPPMGLTLWIEVGAAWQRRRGSGWGESGAAGRPGSPQRRTTLK